MVEVIIASDATYPSVNTDSSLSFLLRLPLAPFQLTHDSSILPKAQDKSLEVFLDSFIFLHTRFPTH